MSKTTTVEISVIVQDRDEWSQEDHHILADFNSEKDAADFLEACHDLLEVVIAKGDQRATMLAARELHKVIDRIKG